MRRPLAFLAFLLLTPTLASGATYYVRTDGNNGNTGLTNSAGGAWRTIGFAVDNVAAGDFIRVQAGTYGERPTPSDDGTSGNPITYVADGVVTFCGADFTNNDYQIWIGFVVDTNAGGCSLSSGGFTFTSGSTNTFIELWNNTFRDALVNGIRGEGTISNSIIVGNVFTSLGLGASAGSGVAITINGSNNFIGYNEMFAIDTDGTQQNGTDTWVVNNYIHDLIETSGHPDFIQNAVGNGALTGFTVEGNMLIGIDSPNDHVANIESSGTLMTENIFRGNVWHNLGSGFGVPANSAGFTDMRYYNNTDAVTVGDSPAQDDAEGGMTLYGSGIDRTFLKNNIAYQSWGTTRTSGIRVYNIENGAVTIDYNLAYDPDGSVTFAAFWNNQANEQSNVNPNFVNFAADDFHLGAGSGDPGAARGTGGPLTTTSGSGTGTTFNVVSNTGGYFRGDNASISQYGGALVVGDTITVGTDVVTIASISGDVITTVETFTWANGEGVYFGNDPSPDLGAYPYKAGGYTLSATFVNDTGSVTVTPNDPALVRMVVCYENSIPTTVDSVSPYTCSVGGGTIDIRVYPRYASPTLWAVATEGEAPPDEIVPAPRVLRRLRVADIGSLMLLGGLLAMRRRKRARRAV